MSKMRSFDRKMIKTAASDLIEQAVELINDLRDETQDNVDNMEEKFSGTDRYQRYSDAVDSLTQASEALEEFEDDDKSFLEKLEIEHIVFRAPGNKKVSRLEQAKERIQMVNDFMDQQHEAGDEDQDEVFTSVRDTLERVMDDLDAVEFS